MLPSVEEGLALVQAQALACGCPVICTPNTGGEDIFRDGEAGFVVPVRNALAIVDRLERLAGDVRLAQEMRVNAVKTVAGMGGWTAYGDSWAEFLKSVVQRGQLRENSHD